MEHRDLVGGMTLETTVVATDDQASSVLEGEAVILQLTDGIYYGLDPVGSSVWSLLQQPRTVREICGRILDEYDVDAPRCEADVLELLDEMRARRLVEIAGPA